MRDLFQSVEYYAFLQETGFLEPFRYSIIRDSEEVAIIQGYLQKDGGRLKRFFSRRAIVNGGPYIADDATDQDLKALLEKCRDSLHKRAIYIETRNFRYFSKYRELFESCGFVYEPHYDFIIDTDSLEIAEANLGKSRKRDIRTSLRDGADVVEDPTEVQIRAFYAILKNLYENKIGTPLFPFDFFLKLYHSGFSKFLLVRYKDEIVGGTVCVYDDETVYEWFACGKDGLYKSIFPSTLATWSGIRFAAESGRKRFDMMGAGAPGDGGYGVRDFKAKFGGELVEYGRFKYICNPLLYAIGKLGVAILKK
jgi:lipid II:glycine glycyltransferase (peptidoglycan interpeptide bridge formation enzyme)